MSDSIRFYEEKLLEDIEKEKFFSIRRFRKIAELEALLRTYGK